MYQGYHIVSSYNITEDAFNLFFKTENIGLSPEEKLKKLNKIKNKVQKIKTQAETNKKRANALYRDLPDDAQISNKGLRAYEILQEQLKQDPSTSITKKEQQLIERVNRYNDFKDKFDKNYE